VENVAAVHTADLDLSTNAGRHQLDRRLVVAAAEVCGSASDADLAGQNDLRPQELSLANAYLREFDAKTGNDLRS